MNRVESAGLTDIGRKRKENQDALFLADAHGLYVVSDGMGGHRAGEVASRLVVEALRDMITGRVPQLPDEDADPALSQAANLLLDAIRTANRNVFDASNNNPAFRGMGATVSVVLFSGESFIAANVGDSPIFLIHKGHIEQLSVSHTLMAEHAAAHPEGKTTLNPKYKHVLTRAVGTHQTVRADICEIQWFPGDVLVICSDGLSGKVSSEEICQAVKQYPPAEACRQLVALANQRGGDDNITVVVCVCPKRSVFRTFVKRFTHLFWRE